MQILKNIFGFLQKAYKNDKAGDHLALRQHIDLSAALFHSTEPDKPLFTAALRGNYRTTLLLTLMVTGAICMLSLLLGCLKSFCRR